MDAWVTSQLDKQLCILPLVTEVRVLHFPSYEDIELCVGRQRKPELKDQLLCLSIPPDVVEEAQKILAPGGPLIPAITQLGDAVHHLVLAWTRTSAAQNDHLSKQLEEAYGSYSLSGLTRSDVLFPVDLRDEGSQFYRGWFDTPLLQEDYQWGSDRLYNEAGNLSSIPGDSPELDFSFLERSIIGSVDDFFENALYGVGFLAFSHP
ncbi:hypothetical protein H0H92_014842 [Tricholoma furcatifolium]|nr:hypothetical protein H0H92_014842 [Tricholoma furcatifolium]